MCGLLGLLTTQQDAAQRQADVIAALRCQRHRGPDETGTWHDADVVLGFNRLSIIDLDSSHQPLRWGPTGSPDRYALTFNGEIYNYLELRRELVHEALEAERPLDEARRAERLHRRHVDLRAVLHTGV